MFKVSRAESPPVLERFALQQARMIAHEAVWSSTPGCKATFNVLHCLQVLSEHRFCRLYGLGYRVEAMEGQSIEKLLMKQHRSTNMRLP